MHVQGIYLNKWPDGQRNGFYYKKKRILGLDNPRTNNS